MYVARWNAVPASVLRISHVPVVRSSLPNARYEFMLEVNRPGLEYGLSSRAREALHHDRGIKRW